MRHLQLTLRLNRVGAVRNFALGDDGGRGEPRLLLTLLCPYLALHTNRPRPPPPHAVGDGAPRAHAPARSGVATDALKLMWAWLGPTKDAGEAAGDAEGVAAPDAAAVAAWRQWEEDGSALRLRLLAGECEEVLAGLKGTALALPPSTRHVGAFHVGHMPIVPSWD